MLQPAALSGQLFLEEPLVQRDVMEKEYLRCWKSLREALDLRSQSFVYVGGGNGCGYVYTERVGLH